MVDSSSPHAVESRPHRPWLAALLSFVFPGLGQAYASRWRPAVLFALPVLVLALLAVAVLTGIAGDLGNSLLSTGFLTAVLVLNVVLLLWRAAAIVHAGLTPRFGIWRAHRRTAGIAVAALLIATVGMHVWVGVVVAHLEGSLAQIFAGADEDRDPDTDVPAPTDGEPGDEPEPINEPEYRWDGDERINILLLGTDAAPGREAVLTDVILVVSVDPADETAVMISVPRDTGFVPLPNERIYADGLFPRKVNELPAAASGNSEAWCPDRPDPPDACGLRTIERSIGLYLGIEIHHYALVDMAGFADLIDALGGIELCLPGRLVDPEFDGSLDNEGISEPLILPEGCNEYNGIDALAYARSRKGWIEMPDGERVPQSDFARSDRQQRVLLAVRTELAQADTIFELPGILGAIGRTVSTDFPRDQAGDLSSLLPLITGPDIDRLVLGYPDYVHLPVNPDANYLLIPKRDAIREEMADIFAPDDLRGWYLGSTAAGPDTEPEAEAPTP
ncbi:MAG: LCP family protein [Candidatus Limnocylindria bacterium]